MNESKRQQVAAHVRSDGTAVRRGEPESFTQMVERVIRDPSIDIARLQQILEMKERMDARSAEQAFDVNLNAVQQDLEPVRRDADNPQTRSKYATYKALDQAVRPVYTKHGFGLSFDTGELDKENMVRVLCYVSCAGHRRTYHIDMPADGKGAKGSDVMTKT